MSMVTSLPFISKINLSFKMTPSRVSLVSRVKYPVSPFWPGEETWVNLYLLVPQLLKESQSEKGRGLFSAKVEREKAKKKRKTNIGMRFI